MIKLLGIALVFSLLFLIQRLIYERLWQKELTIKITFADEHIFEGEQGQLKEVIENRKRLPLSMLKVKFKTDRHLLFDDCKGSRTTDQFYRNDIFRIGGGEKVTRILNFKGGRRGYYTVDGISLVASDLFLTDQMVAEMPMSAYIYVYPKPWDSEEFRQSLVQLNGEVLAKRHLLEDPFEYRGIREYQPFDDMRSINWKATAKTGDLKVNQKNYTSLKSVRIFFNVEDDNIMKKEDCVEASLRIAAGLSSFFLSQGIQVSCYGNGLDCRTGKYMSVAAKAGDGQFDTILRGLARLDLGKPVADFTASFEEILFSESKGTLTCFVAPNQYDDFLALLKKYQAAGNDFVWFYPVSGGRTPEPVPELEKQIRLIHLQS
jgi:uncharacterized protein (DUF58 family)